MAVVAVVLDHLMHWPSGGFVGVDVFFVISGFLITGLLLKEHDRTGSISFSSFYRRRIRRILPAAVSVLAFTVGTAYLIFTTARAREAGVDALWGLLFSANWRFAAVGTDYFQADGPVSPLQHFWSLAVEEQFYFVWPWLMLLILWLGGRSTKWNKARARRAVAIAMAIIIAVSFGWASVQSVGNPTIAYFSTFTRAWELGLGALIAVVSPMFKGIPDRLRPFIAWVGTAGIAWSFLTVTSSMPFPAPWAAAPVLSAILVIAAGTGGNGRCLWPLSNPVTGYVGDISYSLYLWHFPVVIFTGLFLAEGTLAFYASALLIMLALSVASFHLIEQPVLRSQWLLPKPKHGRNKQLRTGSSRFAYAGLSLLTVVALGVSVLALLRTAPHEPVGAGATPVALAIAGTAGSPAPVDNSPQGAIGNEIALALAARSFPEFNPSLDSLGTDNWSKRPEIACMNVSPGNLDACRTGQAGSTKTVAVIGDSFAVAWLPGIRAAFEPLGYQVQALTMGQCPAAAVSVNQEGGAAFTVCDTHLQWAMDRVKLMHPDLTILASAQDSTMRRLSSGKKGQEAVDEIANGLAMTLSQVAGSSGRVAVLSSPPTGKPLQECVNKFSGPGNCTTQLTDDWKFLRDAEKKATTDRNAIYIDTASWFCNKDGYCPGFSGQTPIRVDSGHVSVEYAQKLGPVLAQSLAAG